MVVLEITQAEISNPGRNFFFDLELQIRLKLPGNTKSNKEKEIRMSLKALNPLICSHRV